MAWASGPSVRAVARLVAVVGDAVWDVFHAFNRTPPTLGTTPNPSRVTNPANLGGQHPRRN